MISRNAKKLARIIHNKEKKSVTGQLFLYPALVWVFFKKGTGFFIFFPAVLTPHSPSVSALPRSHAVLTLVFDDDEATTQPPTLVTPLILRFHLPRHYSSSTTGQSLLPKEVCLHVNFVYDSLK